MRRFQIFVYCSSFLVLAVPLLLALDMELHCNLCGEAIQAGERYYQLQGSQKVFCSRCYAQAPRCSLCRLPTAPEDLESTTGACSSCRAKLPRCQNCNKYIMGAAYTYEMRDGIYCPQCKAQLPPCYVCGAPAGRGHWEYPDGRIVCAACGERAVVDTDEIGRIMSEAGRLAEQRLGLRVRQGYSLKIARLNSTSNGPSGRQRLKLDPATSPLYGKELGMHRRDGDRSIVYLLFGMPPELVYEAAAHEYAHVWQAENCAAELAPELREGFAQWVAADILRAKGFFKALERLEKRQDIPYGTGYQRLKSLPKSSILALLRAR